MGAREGSSDSSIVSRTYGCRVDFRLNLDAPPDTPVKGDESMTTTDTLPGSQVRSGHKSTLLAVLGPEHMIDVRSMGDRFYMEGQFPYRMLLQHTDRLVADGSAADAVATEITRAGAFIRPRITIAETADVVTRRSALAIMGGAYHESFHRLWSGQGDITAREIRRVVGAGAVPGVTYAPHQRLLAEVQNVLEDIRIERIGCAVFPGVHTKMADLADFVLDAEQPVRDAQLKGNVNVAQVAMCVLREVGLGYNTVKVREAMAHYRKVCPQAVALVLNGPLTPILRAIVPDVSTPAAIERAKADVALSSILALQALGALVQASQAQPPQPQPPQPQDGGKGGTGKGKPSKGESEASDTSDGSDESDDSDETGDESGDESGGDDSDDSDGDDSDGDGDSDGKSDDDSDESGDDGAGGSDSDGESGDDEGDADGESGEGDTSDGESDGGEPSINDASDGEGGEGGNGSGGGAASDFLKDGANGAGLQDYASALNGELDSARKAEDAKLDNGERPYRPACTSNDRERKVTTGDTRRVERLAASVRSETSFLKAKLRTMFRAMEDGAREHGLKRGPVLSDRFLVDTVGSLRSGTDPRRAFAADDVTLDVSVAASIIIDQSGSMHDKLDGAAQIAYALGDALDAIGAKTVVAGFTTNGSFAGGTEAHAASARMGAHRLDGVDIDVFKGFDERFRSTSNRLGSIRCSGGTPMADGIEYGLRALSARREGYRIMFVLTDGIPDFGHAEVMKSQFRRAAEAGIVIVGVGLGSASSYVTNVFEHHVHADRLADIPRPLVAKLHELVTGRIGNLRGRKVRAA